jgi:hypothetical protein
MEVGGGETVEQIAARLDAKSEYAPLRATGMIILFLALWSIDLWVFKKARLDITCIYPAKILGGESRMRDYVMGDKHDNRGRTGCL